MRLWKNFPETGASALTNYVQVGHRRTAVEYALAGIRRHHDAILEASGHDPSTLEMEGMMRAWVAETLLQGAYLREYHLWEKDCKAYFSEMAQRNGGTLVMKGHPFTTGVWDTLSQFSVIVSPSLTNAIEIMRGHVNVMKHEAGLELDHFISEADYVAGSRALEEFWSHIASAEEFVS
jgi:hypothetical protein